MARAPVVPLLFHNQTDVGRQREKNEDYLGYFRTGTRHLFAVADGMGGEAGGALASRTAVEETRAVFDAYPGAAPPELLARAVQAANDACVRIQQDQPELKGMGSTLDLLLVDGEQAWWAHVGDSRIYLVRGGDARQLTRDHTLIQQMLDGGLVSPTEAAEHPNRHVLNRAIGRDTNVEADVLAQPFLIEAGDAFLMCTDGLADLVSLEEIGVLVSRHDPRRACALLVTRALQRGGHDNISVQVVFKGQPKPVWNRITSTLAALPAPGGRRRRGAPVAAIGLALAAVVLLGVAAAGYWWLHSGSEGQPPATPGVAAANSASDTPGGHSGPAAGISSVGKDATAPATRPAVPPAQEPAGRGSDSMGTAASRARADLISVLEDIVDVMGKVDDLVHSEKPPSNLVRAAADLKQKLPVHASGVHRAADAVFASLKLATPAWRPSQPPKHVSLTEDGVHEVAQQLEGLTTRLRASISPQSKLDESVAEQVQWLIEELTVVKDACRNFQKKK